MASKDQGLIGKLIFAVLQKRYSCLKKEEMEYHWKHHLVGPSLVEHLKYSPL